MKPTSHDIFLAVEHSELVYCFKIINTGESYLTNFHIVNDELKYESSVRGTLAPGESMYWTVNDVLTKSFANTAKVTGLPVFRNGDTIPDETSVEASDPSEVSMVEIAPSVSIENTVSFNEESFLPNSLNLLGLSWK